jgi:hypothetical protein
LTKLERIADNVANLPLDHIARAASTALDETTRILRSPEIARVLRNTDSLVADTRTLVRRIDVLTAPVIAQGDPLAGEAPATVRFPPAATRT